MAPRPRWRDQGQLAPKKKFGGFKIKAYLCILNQSNMTKQIINDNIRNGFSKIGQNTYKGMTIITCQKDEQFYAMIFSDDELQFNTPKYDCPVLTKEVAKAFIVKGSKPTPTQINKIKESLNSTTTTTKTVKQPKKVEVVEYFQELPWPFGMF